MIYEFGTAGLECSGLLKQVSRYFGNEPSLGEQCFIGLRNPVIFISCHCNQNVEVCNTITHY